MQLIKINDPNLVLFVGEALVGNDGVDQLKAFNQALADHSGQDNPRLIDGIVLTKFDTIDDKVCGDVIAFDDLFFMYSNSPHIRTYQNRNLEAVFPSGTVVKRRAHDPRVVCSKPTLVIFEDSILGQGVNTNCASLHPGV